MGIDRFPEKRFVDQPDRVFNRAAGGAGGIMDDSTVPFVQREEILLIIIADRQVPERHVRYLCVQLIFAENDIRRHLRLEPQVLGEEYRVIDVDRYVIIGEVEVHPDLEPGFFVEQGGGQRDHQLIRLAVDIEIQGACAVVVEITEAVRVIVDVICDVQDISEVSVIP